MTSHCLASPQQLADRPIATKDRLSAVVEQMIRTWVCDRIERAGVILCLSHPILCSAFIYCQRVLTVLSLTEIGGLNSLAMGCLLVACKAGEESRHVVDIAMVFHHIDGGKPVSPKSAPITQLCMHCRTAEIMVLKGLGFHLHSVNPHRLLLHTARLLGFAGETEILSHGWAFLNEALRTLAAVRASPWALSCASLRSGCRAAGVELPADWYQIFEVESPEEMDAVDSDVEGGMDVAVDVSKIQSLF